MRKSSRGYAAGKLIAALLGGYALTVAFSVFISILTPLLLDVKKSSVTHLSLLLSFGVYALIFMWSYSANTLLSSWARPFVPSVVLLLLILILNESINRHWIIT